MGLPNLHKDTNPELTGYYSTEDKISGSNGVILDVLFP